MLRPHSPRIVLAVLCLLALAPATARADAGLAIVRQCLSTGSVSGHHSQRAYSQALNELPTDAVEYSDCSALIHQAQLADAGGASGGGPAGATTTAGSSPGTSPVPGSFSPSEQAALNAAKRNGAAGVDVGGQLVRPGLVHVNLGSALNTLPTPLLALLAVLLAGALLALGRLVLDRVRARRSL